jgi:two-component sensor histidine kinase
MRELAHRGNNQLAVVKGMAAQKRRPVVQSLAAKHMHAPISSMVPVCRAAREEVALPAA